MKIYYHPVSTTSRAPCPRYIFARGLLSAM